MIEIRSLSPSEIHVVNSSNGQLKDWRETLARAIVGSEFSKRHKDHRSNRKKPAAVRDLMWDGTARPGMYLRELKGGVGHMWRGKRGLLPSLQQYFGELKGDLFRPPDLQFVLPDGLHDYQLEGLELIRSCHWGRLAFATNAGKGAIIALASQAAVALGFRVLILCNSVAVFDALSTELKTWGKLSVGLINAGTKDPPEEKVCLAMSQTLINRIQPEYATKDKKRRKNAGPEEVRWREWLAGVHMALLDEADFATSDEWQYILNFLPNTFWRFGFSGSFPDENTVEHVLLEESIGPIVARVKNRELIARGISANPTIFVVNFQHGHIAIDYSLSRTQQWHQAYERAIVYNAARHEHIRRLLLPRVQNVVIVQRVDHGAQLAMVLPDSVFISGATPNRMELLKQFENGEFSNLIVTSILDRGSNRLGNVRSIIFASNLGSYRQILQRIGRGLRRGGGKQSIAIFDVADTGHAYFRKPVAERIKLYAEEGFPIRILKLQSG